MKYEVTGDTIIIKYIADGKYKQLELNKNDNIDLDFFGQLIKAKNNKQDAMCDLYAKEVLSYDPSPDRITTMSLTKVEEPSDYTKKQSAKLRIEELTRDKEVVEKEIRDMILPAYKERRIEDLIPDNLEKKDIKEAEERFKELKVRYLQIKDLIEKEERKYDTSKSEPLTHDQLLKKVSNEFENKISKVIGSSAERRKVIEDITDEISPKEELTKEFEELEKSINDFNEELENKLKEKKEEYNISDEEIISDEDMIESSDKKEYKIDITNILSENIYFSDQLYEINSQIRAIKEILEKTDINKKVLDPFINSTKDITLTNQNILKQLTELKNNITEIKNLNKDNKIAYTQNVITKVLKNVNSVIEQRDRIKLLYDTYITDNFVKQLLRTLKVNDAYHINNIKLPEDYNPKRESNIIKNLFNIEVTKAVMLWRDADNANLIFSNKDFLGIFKKTTKMVYLNTTIPCHYITIEDLQKCKFGIFAEYITTEKTNYELPLQLKNTKFYLNLKQDFFTTFQYTSIKNKIDYYQFDIYNYNLEKSSMSDVINIISGIDPPNVEKEMSSGIYSGKIDLDRASTEEKLSEIIRLLQNIGYNLFTLTPNYEESERNKKLKSKGIDLRELFRHKNNESIDED